MVLEEIPGARRQWEQMLKMILIRGHKTKERMVFCKREKGGA
jgi:hypothetical protein